MTSIPSVSPTSPTGPADGSMVKTKAFDPPAFVNQKRAGALVYAIR